MTDTNYFGMGNIGPPDESQEPPVKIHRNGQTHYLFGGEYMTIDEIDKMYWDADRAGNWLGFILGFLPYILIVGVSLSIVFYILVTFWLPRLISIISAV